MKRLLSLALCWCSVVIATHARAATTRTPPFDFGMTCVRYVASLPQIVQCVSTRDVPAGPQELARDGHLIVGGLSQAGEGYALAGLSYVPASSSTMTFTTQVNVPTPSSPVDATPAAELCLRADYAFLENHSTCVAATPGHHTISLTRSVGAGRNLEILVSLRAIDDIESAVQADVLSVSF